MTEEKYDQETIEETPTTAEAPNEIPEKDVPVPSESKTEVDSGAAPVEKEQPERTTKTTAETKKSNQSYFTSNKQSKVYFQENNLDRSTPFSEEEIKKRQENWQRFEEDQESYKNNNFPSYFYAGFWIRSFAYLVDILCIGFITRGTIGLVYNVTGLEPSMRLNSFYGLAALLIYLVYFTLLTKLNRGQTIGKMIFGIRVVGLQEEELSWTTVIIRETVCRFIMKNPPLMLAYVLAAFTHRKQHPGDYFCDTSVVTINLIKAFNKEVRA